jgi:hypothetical protein
VPKDIYETNRLFPLQKKYNQKLLQVSKAADVIRWGNLVRLFLELVLIKGKTLKNRDIAIFHG